MENTDLKYYTPLLEEYFIGFEVEGKVTTKKDGITIEEWFKLPVSNEILSSLLNGEAQRKGGMTLNGFRCKYLNKEDIENCGFKQDFRRTKLTENIGFWIKEDKIYGTYNTISHNLDIADLENNEYLFRGIIKNISELRKLLIQLKIK